MLPKGSNRRPWARPRRSAAVSSLTRKSAGDFDLRLERIERAVDALVAGQSVGRPPKSRGRPVSDQHSGVDHGAQRDNAVSGGGTPANGITGKPLAVSEGARDNRERAYDRISDYPEYKILKRKYRRAQNEVVQLCQELVEVRREIEALKSRTISEQLSAIFSARLQQLLDRIPGLAMRNVRKNQLAHITAIRKSGLFDVEWYLRTYPDVAAAGIDPIRHYIASGWQEARDPGPDFSSSAYLKANKDVAKSGMNPLLHYIEFGLGEGRSIGVRAKPSVVRSAEIFDPPAPVIQCPLEVPSPVRWKRAHMLIGKDEGQVSIGGQVIGISCISETVLLPVLQRLERLTGQAIMLAGALASGHESVDHADMPLLSDAWFIRDATLRLHWSGRSPVPLVIRALQWSGSKGLAAVGEGLIAAPTEFLDLELVTPLHPVLLVFVTPEGAIVGGELLAFPSLGRGGLHYAERGALEWGGTTAAQADLLACSRALEEAWARLVSGDATPFLRDIRVNVEGSDGTGPLLRKDVQDWLADILAVDLVEPYRSGTPSSRAEAYVMGCLSPSERNSATTGRSMAPARLVLPHDCLPTLQLLVAPSSCDAGSDVVRAASFISACDDTAMGALTAVLSADGEFQSLVDLTDGQGFWPILTGAVAPDNIIAAIRREPREPALGQLLQPSARSVSIFQEGTPSATITLLIEPSSWDEKAWAACLIGLRQQMDAGLSEVCCYGSDAAAFVAEIERALGVPTRAVPDWVTAVQVSDAQLVLHVGKGVVLHDPRTIRHLAQLVADGSDGASCPLLAFSSHARDWTVAIRSAGCIATPAGVSDFAPDVTRFWNTLVPVQSLPADFWIVRATHLLGDPERSARLVLSTRVSASHLAAQDGESSAVAVNLEAQTNSLQISRWLG